MDVAERLGNPAQIAFEIGSHGVLAFHMGDWPGARRELDRALAMGREIGVFWRSMFLLIYLGCLDLAQGEWAAAVHHLDEGVAQAQRSGELQAVRHGQAALAEHDLLVGRPDAAHARLVALLDRGEAEEWFVTCMLPTLAWALLDLSQVDEAANVAAQALRRARATNNRLTWLDALRVGALIATRQRRWAEAKRTLEEALSLAREVGDPYRHARLLQVYGAMHAAKGEPEPAVERLEAALAIFRRLGARKDAEQAQQAIAELQRL